MVISIFFLPSSFLSFHFKATRTEVGFFSPLLDGFVQSRSWGNRLSDFFIYSCPFFLVLLISRLIRKGGNFTFTDLPLALSNVSTFPCAQLFSLFFFSLHFFFSYILRCHAILKSEVERGKISTSLSLLFSFIIYHSLLALWPFHFLLCYHLLFFSLFICCYFTCRYQYPSEPPLRSSLFVFPLSICICFLTHFKYRAIV